MKTLWKHILLGVAVVSLMAATTSAQSTAAGSNAASATAKSKAPAAPASANSGAQAAKNSGHASETVEYKDPEDMTTRYRPGNNKATATNQGSGTSSGSSAAAHATAKQSGIPACDGASKDAAKCVPPPPPAGTAAKHANSIDSFTVKQ